MSLPVFLRPEASRDVEEAHDYYESYQSGLGQAFLDRVNEALTKIGIMPEMYSIIWRNVRMSLLRQFTYVVYYRIHDDWVEVIAVMHGSRDPSAWKTRVD